MSKWAPARSTAAITTRRAPARSTAAITTRAGARPLDGGGYHSVTRDSRVSVVSLEIPGIVVPLEIPVFRIFLVKISRKIVKIGFSDSRDQNKIVKFS